jgi:hypothetical protein
MRSSGAVVMLALWVAQGAAYAQAQPSPLEIAGSRSEGSSEERYEGAFEARDGQVWLRGQGGLVERDAEGKAVEVEVSREARISFSGGYASAQRIRYEVGARVAWLEGDVRLQRGREAWSAQRARVELGAGRVELEPARGWLGWGEGRPWR